jgi:o-succinylbenzoate---CoA ligase
MKREEFSRIFGRELGVRRDEQAIAVEGSNPVVFQKAFAAAVGSAGPVFLVDPMWGASERGALEAALKTPVSAADVRSDRGWLMIPTGGSSGGIKFARHDQDTITAAVSGFCQHFGIDRVNAVGVLPLHHVSGLMAWMRCAITGGEFRSAEWKDIAAGKLPPLGTGDWVISLVPTQLQRLLDSGAVVDWLRGFRIIFVGGGPVWPELEEAAAQAKLPVSLGYGMTETAAMVTALQPVDFLSGIRSSGLALPHATISVGDEGTIRVAGQSVFRGYFPGWRTEREFTTEDLGRIDPQGHLHVLGRRDAVIITGGKKVHPAQVEAALRASGEFSDVAVVGLADREWGEMVVACYPAGERAPDLARAVVALAPHERPKRFVALREWPRTAQGKVSRAKLLAAIPRA